MHAPLEHSAPSQPPCGSHVAGLALCYAFDQVCFRHVNFTVESGRWLAVTGPSGCGKSTLLRLIAGLYPLGSDPQSGVWLDRRRLDAWQPRELRRRLAFLDQSVRIFSATIRENLCLWDENITEQDLNDAVRDACFDEVIAHQPNALAALLGEGGVNLSMGEKQRLQIARALVVRPSLLIMDEASNALDAPTEQRIFAALRRRGLTVILVSHRESVVQACDAQLRLNDPSFSQGGIHAA